MDRGILPNQTKIAVFVTISLLIFVMSSILFLHVNGLFQPDGYVSKSIEFNFFLKSNNTKKMTNVNSF